VYFDANTDEWRDLWNGTPHIELDYSPDRQWITFFHEPNQTVWKCRGDHSGCVQLARSPAEPTSLTGHVMDEESRSWQGMKSTIVAFSLQAEGGTAVEIQPKGGYQGVPTWSPDDASLLFGERRGHRPARQMCLHLLSLASGQIRDLNGTTGLWSPRYSPDGKSVLAVSTDSRAVMLLVRVSQWREVSEVFGRAALLLDERSCRMRMHEIAEAGVSRLRPEDRAVFAAFARGVNAFIDFHRGDYPLEFSLPGHSYDPRPWRMANSVLVGLVMYRDLTDFPRFDFDKGASFRKCARSG